MAAVPCAECNHPVSRFATGCWWCGAPISKAVLPPPAPPPPARVGPVAKAVTTVGAAGFALLLVLNSGKGKMATDVFPHRPSPVPQAGALVSMTVPVSECRHDWRTCFDNRDWVRNADLTGPRGACLALATSAAGYGHFSLDRSWSGPRFDSYVSDTSIRRGHIVLVDRAGLVRDASGGWVRTPLHCTFDLGSRHARSVALP